MTHRAIPERYHQTVIPHIMIRGASAAIEFYEQAFGATELFRISHPHGPIVHAEIRIGDSLIMVGDAEGAFHDPQSLGGSSVGLHFSTEDVDALFAQAIGAGAQELQPVQDMFYGDRMGMLKDPYATSGSC